jgi:hypothetical protein
MVDPYCGVRYEAINALSRLALPHEKLAELLQTTCTNIPEEQTQIMALQCMGEVDLKEAIPFVRSLALSDLRPCSDKVLSVAITTLAELGDWKLEAMFVELATARPSAIGDFEFYESSSTAAMWALAKKAGYEFKKWSPGYEWAWMWWILDGKRKYGPNAPPVDVAYGEPVDGLAIGIFSNNKVMIPMKFFEYYVVVKNVTQKPILMKIGAPMGKNNAPYFKPQVEVTSVHGQVRWNYHGATGIPSLAVIPPNGISGIPVSLNTTDFVPAISPGDTVCLSIVYSTDKEYDDQTNLWEGTAKSGTLELTVGDPIAISGAKK